MNNSSKWAMTNCIHLFRWYFLVYTLINIMKIWANTHVALYIALLYRQIFHNCP